MNALLVRSAGFAAAILWVASAAAQDDPATPLSPTGAALRAMFNVRQAPQAKSMGLFQANFLDAVAPTGQSLQLAVVLDSTDSMSRELNQVRENLPYLVADLYRIHDGALATTVVTYADVGESERPVRLLSPAFVDDEGATARLIDEIQPATGRPYFPESIDLGVFTAIDQLPWSSDESVARWLLLIGDAPPYDPAFFEAETKAQRWYDTEFLVDLANKKKLQIHCLLCPSRDEEKQAYEESLVKTRRFMSRLADGTGGQMLDLSYPFVRERLLEVSRQPQPEFARVGIIHQHEIDAVRRGAAADPAPSAQVRVAVLPFLPLESMTFFHEKPAVQLAAEIRHALRAVPNVVSLPPRQIEDEISRLQGDGLPWAEWPQALALRLRADFVVTGDLRAAEGMAFATVHFHGRSSAEPLLTLASTAPPERLALTLLADLQRTEQQPESLKSLAAHLGGLADNPASSVDATGSLATLDAAQRARLLGAFEALEQSLGFALGDPQSEQLLAAADEQLTAFLQQQNEHAFAQVLRASGAYNQAKLYEGRGELEKATERYQTSLNAIGEAYRLRTQLVDRLTRLEVDADYHLLVTRDHPQAVARYEEIVGFAEASPVRPALRAHWMLAGMRLGAWGIGRAEGVYDPDQAREHLLQILAWWPESSESAAIKRYLLWDEPSHRSRTPYLPIDAQPAATRSPP